MAEDKTPETATAEAPAPETEAAPTIEPEAPAPEAGGEETAPTEATPETTPESAPESTPPAEAPAEEVPVEGGETTEAPVTISEDAFGPACGPTLDKVMAEKVVTVGMNATVNEAVELLTKHRISQLPVTDGGKYIGMITATDVYHIKSVFQGTPSEQPRDRALGCVTINNFVRRSDLPPITPERTLGEVIGLMLIRDLQAVAVTDPQGHLRGIVTWHDVLKYVQESGCLKD